MRTNACGQHERLLDAAVEAGVVRPGIEADDLLRAVAPLCHGPHGQEPPYARKMVELRVDGLRYGGARESTRPENDRYEAREVNFS